jgi:glycosyltransferase involved in cell wall biosynthesis
MSLNVFFIARTQGRAARLDHKIALILAQDYPSIKYIFVDGGSADGTPEKSRGLPSPYRLIENVHGGINRAMYECVKADCITSAYAATSVLFLHKTLVFPFIKLAMPAA